MTASTFLHVHVSMFVELFKPCHLHWSDFGDNNTVQSLGGHQKNGRCRRGKEPLPEALQHHLEVRGRGRGEALCRRCCRAL